MLWDRTEGRHLAREKEREERRKQHHRNRDFK